MPDAFIKIVVLHTDKATGRIYLAPWLSATLVAAICLWVVMMILIWLIGRD